MLKKHALVATSLVAPLIVGVGACGRSTESERLAEALERIARLEARINEMPEPVPGGGFIVRDDTGRYVKLTATGFLIHDGESEAFHTAGSALLKESGRVAHYTAESAMMKDKESGREAFFHVGGLRLAINDKARLIAGEALHVERLSGTETTIPATFVIYDADGGVRWMSPR